MNKQLILNFSFILFVLYIFEYLSAHFTRYGCNRRLRSLYDFSDWDTTSKSNNDAFDQARGLT